MHYNSRREPAAELAAELGHLGRRAIVAGGDLTRPDEVTDVFNAAVDAFGGVDIVVANAGVSAEPTPLALVSDEVFERVINGNTRGTFYVLREAARRVRDDGRIIIVGSSTTAHPAAGFGAYAASKALATTPAGCRAKYWSPTVLQPFRRLTMNTDHDRLAGTVALITGAGSGIGEAAARELARLGASVVVVARKREELERVVRSIEAGGGKAEMCPLDVTDDGAGRRMVEVAVERFGRLDYAVNNAGTTGRGAFLDVKVEDFDRTMSTNVRAVFLAMQAEIPAILRSGGGAIVNTASVGGLVGVPKLASYVASKHAIVGLTKSVALEYATQALRVNAIAPGGTETAMISSGTQEQKETLASYSAMKRLADPLEIARGIVYLLADATFTTGTVLAADGGQSAS